MVVSAGTIDCFDSNGQVDLGLPFYDVSRSVGIICDYSTEQCWVVVMEIAVSESLLRLMSTVPEDVRSQGLAISIGVSHLIGDFPSPVIIGMYSLCSLPLLLVFQVQ